MSTTRWIIETDCGHEKAGNGWCRTDDGHEIATFRCSGVESVVVDPDNLPPERVRTVSEVIRTARITGRWDELGEAAVRAFLSDPEPGDQT